MKSGITGGFNIWIYGKGLVRGYIISLALFLLGAILITYTGLGENIIPVLTSVIMIVSIAYAAIYVAIHIKQKGWLHGGLIGILYIFILILLSKAFVTGYIVDRIAYFRIFISMVAGVIGGMIGINMK
ncbi:TIGR04086 family membrane protein [Clostridium formicaceticum]|uniref:TIGR04086 family membrane protein n=1 Tax=Clostridium formicaceticum TaxID=1497 RepID=A0AAC9RI28_9CLOT|nr:TIGR04086 family membrane protein [Clostridium formicaceticum]AOY76943.1 hypothetical protein BJL90_14400 [Clostridium formicaceticum]ARE87424.1 hypothetical protein CLFO_18240 [Clostridium formicaceticum]